MRLQRHEPVDIVLACCRDESDIIAAFIDFYFDQGFDYVCLVDNGSRDDTVTQALGHARCGRIRLHRDPRPGYDMRLLEYLRLFEPLASRWIFFIDVDELVPLPGGIKGFAGELPPDVTVLELPTAEMIPEASRPALLSTRRDATVLDEVKLVWKTGIATKIYCGKHGLEGEPLVRWRDERLLIRHFHTRSEMQFRRKLSNRIQTDDAIAAAGAADLLSAFARAERASWIQNSRALLQPDGWSRECQRLARLPWVEDRSVSDWYRGQQ